MTDPDWIAAEQLGGRLRVWQMSRDGSVLAEGAAGLRASAEGAAPGFGLTDALTGALNEALGGTPPSVPVLLSGAETRNTPAVPCLPPDMAQADALDGIHLLPGVHQAAPLDRLGAEATRVAGFVARNPNFDGVICLPGARSRWVHVSAGEIVSFRSFLTGTLFRLLAGSDAVGFGTARPQPGEALLAAADQAMGRPAALAGDLSAIAAECRLGGLDAETAASRALGLLIGLELAAAKPYWLGQNVAVVADGAEAAPHVAVLQAQAVPAIQADGARMGLDGLRRAYRGA